jgi:hypothetical protein
LQTVSAQNVAEDIQEGPQFQSLQENCESSALGKEAQAASSPLGEFCAWKHFFRNPINRAPKSIKDEGFCR